MHAVAVLNVSFLYGVFFPRGGVSADDWRLYTRFEMRVIWTPSLCDPDSNVCNIACANGQAFSGRSTCLIQGEGTAVWQESRSSLAPFFIPDAKMNWRDKKPATSELHQHRHACKGRDGRGPGTDYRGTYGCCVRLGFDTEQAGSRFAWLDF